VLTGGAAKLPAIAECAAKVFGTPARLGEAPSWVNENLRDPGYHTALGILYYGVSAQGDRAGRRAPQGRLPAQRDPPLRLDVNPNELPLEHQVLCDRNVAIKLVGVGGAGSNAVDRLKMENLERLQLAVINTDTRRSPARPSRTRS
jgi:cell division ATPase FtsA